MLQTVTLPQEPELSDSEPMAWLKPARFRVVPPETVKALAEEKALVVLAPARIAVGPA